MMRRTPRFSLHSLTFAVAASAALIAPTLAQKEGSYRRADGQSIEASVLPAQGCAPLAIISHGLGGNSRGNAPLAAVLNRAGYRVVVPSHAESGPRTLFSAMSGGRQALDRTAADPNLLRLRLEDISAILAAEKARCTVPFTVLAGHSMGARTVAIEAGAVNSAGLRGADRFDAYVAISPLGEGVSMFPRGAYQPVRKPMLMITGTRDNAVSGGYETRLSAFDGLQAGRKRLAIIDGASHMALGGRDANVGDKLGALATDFLQALRPGPWRSARAQSGVLISDK